MFDAIVAELATSTDHDGRTSEVGSLGYSMSDSLKMWTLTSSSCTQRRRIENAERNRTKDSGVHQTCENNLRFGSEIEVGSRQRLEELRNLIIANDSPC